MRPHRRTEARSPQSLRPRVEWLEGRCVFSVGLLDTDPSLFLAVRSVASFESIVVNEFGEPSPEPIVDVLDQRIEPIAIIDWGDGVVTEAKVTTDDTGQTVVTAERHLDAATTYDATLLLADSEANSTVVTLQITTAVPAPAFLPPPEPETPTVPVAPPPRPIEAEPVAEVTATTEEEADPSPPPSKPVAEQQPVVVRITVRPPVDHSQAQFEAGAVRASLSASVPPTVSVSATSPGGAVLVSAGQVMRSALPPATPQPSATEFVAAPRSFEVVAATRVSVRTTYGRSEPRAASLFDVDWHGVALANGAAETDEVLTALAAESVNDAPFFAAVPEPDVPPERDSLWQSAYVVIAAMIGVGVRFYFVRDDENGSLDECTT